MKIKIKKSNKSAQIICLIPKSLKPCDLWYFQLWLFDLTQSYLQI